MTQISKSYQHIIWKIANFENLNDIRTLAHESANLFIIIFNTLLPEHSEAGLTYGFACIFDMANGECESRLRSLQIRL